MLTCYVYSTKIGEISDISKCFENFVSQALGILTRIYAAELRYKMNVMGWSMRDKEYASWKNAVNKKFGNGSFNVPQKKTAGYNYGGMKNKGRIRLTSTAQYGLTIFWRTIK